MVNGHRPEDPLTPRLNYSSGFTSFLHIAIVNAGAGVPPLRLYVAAVATFSANPRSGRRRRGRLEVKERSGTPFLHWGRVLRHSSSDRALILDRAPSPKGPGRSQPALHQYYCPVSKGAKPVYCDKKYKSCLSFHRVQLLRSATLLPLLCSHPQM